MDSRHSNVSHTSNKKGVYVFSWGLNSEGRLCLGKPKVEGESKLPDINNEAAKNLIKFMFTDTITTRDVLTFSSLSIIGRRQKGYHI